MKVPMVDELFEISEWFAGRDQRLNASLLIQAGNAVQAAGNFFAWFNRHYPAPSLHPDHEWNRLGLALQLSGNSGELPSRAVEAGSKRAVESSESGCSDSIGIAAPAAAVQPVAWRHSHTHCLYETEEEVPLADGDEWAVPLFLAAAAVQSDAERDAARELLIECSEALGHARRYGAGDWSGLEARLLAAIAAMGTAGKEQP
jgi:hypothetical protein